MAVIVKICDGLKAFDSIDTAAEKKSISEQKAHFRYFNTGVDLNLQL